MIIPSSEYLCLANINPLSHPFNLALSIADCFKYGNEREFLPFFGYKYLDSFHTGVLNTGQITVYFHQRTENICTGVHMHEISNWKRLKWHYVLGLSSRLKAIKLGLYVEIKLYIYEAEEFLFVLTYLGKYWLDTKNINFIPFINYL